MPSIQYVAVTDRVVRPRPTLPTLGAAGTIITDPSYGSRILRVSDYATVGGASLRTIGGNGNTRAWNLASNRLVTTPTSGGCLAWNFDAATMQATRFSAGLNFLASNGVTFSSLDQDVVFGVSSAFEEATVTKFHFVTQTYTTVVGVRSLIANVDATDRTYLRALTTAVSSGVEILTFIFGGTGQERDHYVYHGPVTNIAAGRVLDTVASTINGVALPGGYVFGMYLHSSHVDQSGRYLILGPSTSQAGPRGPAYLNPAAVIWDTVTDTFTELGYGGPGEGGGHGVSGYGVWVNFPNNAGDGFDTRYRSLAAPLVMRSVVSPFEVPHDDKLANHGTWENNDGTNLLPLVGAWYRVPQPDPTPGWNANTDPWLPDTTPWRAWDEEIVSIDPTTGVIARFCHHRSLCNALTRTIDTDWFWYTPRPNVSPDGRWAAFTSNWEKTLGQDTGEVNFRQDVFVVELPGTLGGGGGGAVPSLHRRHGRFGR